MVDCFDFMPGEGPSGEPNKGPMKGPNKCPVETAFPEGYSILQTAKSKLHGFESSLKTFGFACFNADPPFRQLNAFSRQSDIFSRILKPHIRR